MFSVIIPLYNKEESIRETIYSVLNQEFKEFEMVIVNDGSGDRSLEIARSIEDKRITIVDKKNEGVSSARNLGIKQAKFNYIAFIDADDVWDKGFLSHMRVLIKKFPLADVYGCQVNIFSNNNVTVMNAVHERRGYIDDFFSSSVKAHILTSSSIVISKSCFNNVGYFDTKYKRGEDVQMWVKLAKNYKIAFEPKPLATYRIDAENRACHSIPSLKYYYLEFQLLSRPYYERQYFLHFAEVAFHDMIKSRRLFSIIQVMIKYNLLFPLLVFRVLKLRSLNIGKVKLAATKGNLSG